MTTPPIAKLRLHHLFSMKTKLYISSLLAVCVTCVTQADELTISASTSKTIEGDLTTNRITIKGGNTPSSQGGSLIVTGKTTIDANLTSGNGSQLQMGSSLQTESILFKSSTTSLVRQFTIFGTVKTNSFKVESTVESTAHPAIINITSGGRIESLSGEKGTLEVGKNCKLDVGNPSQNANGTIHNMNTVINGGTLNVKYYATMNGITLKNDGIININNTRNETWGYEPIEDTIDLGDINVEDGTLSLNGALITSDISLNSGKLNIIGDVETGALTLNGGTITFSADSTIDLGEESLILGDNVAITLNVDSLDNIAGVELFKTTGNVTGLDTLTVTLVDSTGATKKTAVSYSNGSVVTGTVPEPTTATLSLLALAGLAARRRRASR